MRRNAGIARHEGHAVIGIEVKPPILIADDRRVCIEIADFPVCKVPLRRGIRNEKAEGTAGCPCEQVILCARIETRFDGRIAKMNDAAAGKVKQVGSDRNFGMATINVKVA